MHVETQDPQDQDLLVRGLAHRMNNILTVFHGYVGLMLENEDLDISTRDGLCRIKAGARAATELIDRANSLVRQHAVVCRDIVLSDFLTRLTPAIEALRKQPTTFEVSLPDSLPPLRADSGRLRTALLELLRNAFEAVAPVSAGSVVRIEVTLKPCAEVDTLPAAPNSTHWISIAVVDNGPGIPADVAPRIFQPFFSTKRKADATGLGLNVAKGLVHQCGGALAFESRPGRTHFELLLPAADQDAA
jgi:signal transduction histidine kinase